VPGDTKKGLPHANTGWCQVAGGGRCSAARKKKGTVFAKSRGVMKIGQRAAFIRRDKRAVPFEKKLPALVEPSSRRISSRLEDESQQEGEETVGERTN